MKLKQTSSIIGLILLTGALNLQATSASWLGGTSALWSLSANWSGSPVTVPGAADTATFNAASVNTTIDVGTGLSILNIIFDTSSAAAYTIGTGAANSESFTLANSGGITMNSAVANNQLFNTVVLLGTATAGSYTFTNNSAANTLAFAGNIQGGTGGTGAAKTLNVTGSGNTTISGNVANGGATSLAVNKTGTGALTLSGTANLNGGTLSVSGGTMNLTGSAALSSTTSQFLIGTASGTPAAVYQSGSSTATAKVGAGGWQLGSAAGASGYYNLSGGTITIQNTGELDPAGSGGGAGTFGQFDMSGGAVNVGVSGTGNTYFLPCRGAAGESSVVNFSGGTVTVLSGMLDNQIDGYSANWGTSGSQTNVTTISGSALFQSLTASVKLNEPNYSGNVGILNLNGGTWQMLGLNNSYNLNVRVNFNGGTVKAGNSANTTFLGNSGAAYVYGGGATVDNNGQNITITQSLQSPAGSGVSTIPVSGGTGYVMPPQVQITGGGGSGATAYAQIGGGAVTNIVVTSPGINYSSVPTVTLVGGGYTSAATLGTVTTATNTSGVLTVQGAGTLTLSGASTYTNSTIISAGALTLGGAGQLGGGNYTGAITNNGTLIYNSSAAQILSGGIYGSGTLTNQGGTLTLSNANSYSGATIVTGGKLIGAAGSGAGAANSAVAVTPASSTAVLAISYTGGNNQWACSNLTFNAGGIGTGLEFDFATAPSTTTAPLNITSNLTFNASPTIFVTFPPTVAAGYYPLVTVGGTAPVTVPALNTRGFSGATSIAWGGHGFGANTLVLTVPSGTYSAIINPLNWASSGSGTWDVNDSGNNIWKDSSATPSSTYYQEFSVGDNVVFGDKNISANTAVTLNSTVNPASVVFTNSLYNYSIAGSGTIAGGDSLTKYGSATLSLSTSNTYTGGTTVNAGRLNLDFTQSGAPGTNIIGAAGAVTLAGATLGVIGNASTASSQTIGGATVNPGLNVIVASNNTPTLNLGTFNQTAIGSQTMFVGPAYVSSAYGATPVTNPATGTITTTTLGLQNWLLWPSTRQSVATVGLYEWASVVTSGSGAQAIYAGSQQTAGTFYSVVTGNLVGHSDNNLDVAANFTFTGSTPDYCDTMRFNANSALTFTTPAGSGKVYIGGILVTPNVGANNTTVANNGFWISPAAGAAAIDIYQNNILGELIFSCPMQNGIGTTAYAQAGAGTVVLAGSGGSSTYTLSAYLNGGSTVINNNAQLGATATAAALNLNGGTLVITNGSLSLDNGSGANKRPITLLGNGGGLAAQSGYTLTVDGLIGGAAGTGPLVIGIPASAANGGVASLLPGTGSIANGQAFDTANTTPVFGTGTVKLNGAGNSFSGGVTILGGATLNINSEWQLGGSVYGGLTFNNGTLQYSNTLMNGFVDITGNSATPSVAQTVTLAGNATIDVNGNSIIYTNTLGNGGSGALMVYSSTGTGSLNLLAGNNYSGGTTVTNATLLVNNPSGSGTGSGTVTVATNGTLGGTGTISGSVNWQPGSAVLFTAGSPLTVGVVTLNSNAVTVNVPGVTPLSFGTYTLMNYTTAGSTGAFTNAPLFNGPGAVGGSITVITNYGGHVYLTISSGGALAAWTNNANGNWSAGTNWSSNPNVPHAAGDTAFLGVSSAYRTVTLDVNETVGGILFTNPNSFAVTGSGSVLTLDNAGSGAAFTVISGTSNAVQTSVALNDNAAVVVSSGKSLAISGTISNSPSVTKTLTVSGAGTTILSGANSYGPAAGTVGTTLSGGGTLQVATASALGAGDVSVTANSTLQAGAAVTLANNLGIASAVTNTVDNNGNNLTLNGVISGTGSLNKINAGTLTLNGNNSLSGSLAVNGGTLSISSATNVGTTSIILNGGDLLGTGSFYTHNNIGVGPTTGATPGTALIDAATGQTFELDGNITTAGNTGANNLTVNSLAANPGTVVLGGNNTFTGTTIIYTNTLVLDNPLALQNSTLNYSSGTLDFSGITAATLAGLTSTNNNNLALTNTAGAAVTLTVGNNSSAAYAGIVSGSGWLVKTGTGTQTIGTATSGGASYTGGTISYNGTLVLDGNGSVSMNAGANSIYLDASLGITALNLVDSAAVTTSGGVYLASEPLGGSGGGNGYPFMTTLIVQNNAVLNAGSFGFGNPGSSRAAGGSLVTVTNSGTLNVSGTFNIMNASGSQGGSVSVNLNGGTLAAGNFVATGLGSGAHANSINFNGGILKANVSDNGSSPLFLPVITALTAYVNSNGLPFNANGYNVTIAQPLVHGNGTPDGGLTVFGGGMLTLTASNSYTGVTTVSNVVLSVNNTTGSGTGNNTVNVLTNGYLGGSGTIYGAVTVANYGHTLPGGTNGNTAGVTTTVSNLTYNTGGEADFNLSSLYYSGNDELVVKGALNGNGVSIGISPTDVSTNMDATGDYVLFHVTGSYISGFNVTPVWRGATPINAAYYSVLYNGSDVVLHYSPITLLSASVTPNPATRNQVVTFTVNATAVPGIDPAVGIYVNAAPIGGSSPLYLKYAGGNSYTNSTTVTTGLGTNNLSYTVTDLSSDTSSGVITLILNSFTEVWDGLGSDNQWVTGNNWLSNLAPGYGDAVTFAGNTRTTPNMESSYTLGSVTFTNGAGAFDITNSASTLTLLYGGVTNLSANVQTLDVPVSLAGKPTFNAAAGNLVLNYPVADDGSGVTFAGANTTTLAGGSTYTGNTTISAGTLAITGTGQLGSGTYAGNLTNNGTLNYNSSAAQTLSGIISGTGSIVHNGTNTLTVSGANTTYSGIITVNKLGTLLAGANTSLGIGTNILMGGTLGASVDDLRLNGSKLSVPSGTNGLVNMTSQMRLPALYGSGTLAINLNNANPVSVSQPGDSFSACANFSGTLNITGNVANAQINCYANGGSFDGQLQNATVNLITGAGGGVSLVGVDNSGGNDVYIGAINVDAASSLGGSSWAGKLTYRIGALGGLSDIEGAIVNGSGGSPSYLIKYGTGTLLLNNSGNTYSGNTTVSNGTLLVNGQITASPVTVTSGGILSGIGSFGGAVTNNAGALLVPGNNSVGTLTFNNNLTLNATSTNRFVVTTAGGASNSVAITAGTLTPNTSVIAINTAGSATLGAGTNTLFNYSGSTISGSFRATPVFDTVQTGLATNAFVYDTGSQIQLVVTNLQTVNLNPTNITATVTGSTLSLTWPADHLGWTLQTNAVDLANTNYWFAYPGSATVTNVNITINPAQTNVFFRMVYP